MIFSFSAVGRLKPGVSVPQAASELAAIAAAGSDRYPSSNANIGATARALRDELVGPVRTALLLLTASAALVLLIACANLTSLQLGRIQYLQREIAIRSALGATRARLFSLIAIEAVVLSVIAGAIGLVAGLWSVRAVIAMAPPNLVQAANITIDGAVVGYVFVLSVVAGTLFGCMPAYRATRPAPADLLRGRSGADRRYGSLRPTLVAFEVAVATTLLVSATVLLVSLSHVLGVDPGFDAEGVIAADVRLARSRYPTLAHQSAFFARILERLRAIPGVQYTCATNALPFETEGTMTYVPDGTTTLIGALPVTVSPDCFQALGIALGRGRLFAAREVEPVAIVSERFARRAWPDADPIGKAIRIGLPDGDPLTVIGVVADSRRVSLEAVPFAQVYQLASQAIHFVPTKIVVRAAGADASVIPQLRHVVREVDRDQPVENIRTLEGVVGRSMAPRRFNLTLLGAFALLAVTLAAVGVYGLLAQLVAQRRVEIGVRLALGAAPSAIVRLVTGAALRSVALGVTAGLCGAWASARVLQRFVFGVSPTDPAIYAGAALLLGVIAALAAYVPTRRATRIDPLVTLRAD